MAWVSSAGLNSETTSTASSATAEDRVPAGAAGRHGKRDADEGGDGEQGADPGGAFVERFGRRLVVGVGPVVEVVHACFARPARELVKDLLASRREGLAAQVGDGLL